MPDRHVVINGATLAEQITRPALAWRTEITTNTSGTGGSFSTLITGTSTTFTAGINYRIRWGIGARRTTVGPITGRLTITGATLPGTLAASRGRQGQVSVANGAESVSDDVLWSPGATLTVAPILEWQGGAGATRTVAPNTNPDTDGAWLEVLIEPAS